METAQTVVFLLGAVGLTLAALVTDIRTRRIPNKLTIPFFFAGLAYQVVFNGWAGLGDGMLGFSIGFGALLLLWLIGGGGGGDVKLMGALSVWLGFRMTLVVLIASTVTVILLTVGVVAWSAIRRGARTTKDKYTATGESAKAAKARRRGSETVREKSERRIMAYAIPVAIATWAVILWHYPNV